MEAFVIFLFLCGLRTRNRCRIVETPAIQCFFPAACARTRGCCKIEWLADSNKSIVEYLRSCPSPKNKDARLNKTTLPAVWKSTRSPQHLTNSWPCTTIFLECFILQHKGHRPWWEGWDQGGKEINTRIVHTHRKRVHFILIKRIRVVLTCHH
jgi:hypothetical protein